MRVAISIFALLIMAGGITVAAGVPQKKKTKIKPAYITSPPVKVKSHVRKGKVVRSHDRQRKNKTNP